MSTITITYTAETATFAFQESELDGYSASIAFYVEDPENLAFSDLQIACEISGIACGITTACPDPRATIHGIDHGQILAATAYWQPQAEATVTIRLTVDGDVRTGSATFVPPLPSQPYPSWVWDGYTWAAPVSMPLGSGIENMEWSEGALEWVERATE